VTLRVVLVQVVLQARTQQEAEQAAMPIIEGLAIDCSLHGLDLLPLLTGDPNDTDPLVKPARLKLSGRTKFKGRLTDEAQSSALDEASRSPYAAPGAGKAATGSGSTLRSAAETRPVESR
jgi:hypothetical protein